MIKKASILKDETIDGLLGGKLSLIQRTRGYRFSLDAVVLAHFVRVQGKKRVADLGTGNGVIPILLAAIYPSVQVVGLEIQEAMAERALRSVALNHMEDRVEIVRGDVRSVEGIFPSESFDMVLSNPPYRRLKSGRVNPDPERYVARHEVEAALPDFLRGAAYLLRSGGRVALIYPATRAAELLVAMRESAMEPKRLRFVHSFADRPAELVLAEGAKGGGREVRIMPPLVVFAKEKIYTEELQNMFSEK